MFQISDASALLEKLILPTIQDQLYNKKVLMKYFNKDNAGLTFKNDKIYITAETSGHSGVAFTGGTGNIAIGKNTNAQMEVSSKYGYGSHTIWDSALEAVSGQPGSLISLVKNLGTSLENEFQKSINRQLYGNGEGVLTTTSGATTSNAVVPVVSTRHLRIGQEVLIGTKAQVEAGSPSADLVTIVSINSLTSITVSSAITVASGDRIVINGTYSGSAYQELTGLKNLISNEYHETITLGGSPSSFQGVARQTSDWTNSYVNSDSATLTEAMMIEAITQASEFGTTDIIVTTPALRNKYASLLTAMRRENNTIDLKGGFKGLDVSVGESPIAMVADYDCPTGEMFFLDTKTFSIAQLSPLQYLRSGSGGIMTDVYDTNGARLPGYQTTMKFYGNLVCTKPRANARFTNKTV